MADSYDRAIADMGLTGAGTRDVPAPIYESWACDRLGIDAVTLGQMDVEEVVVHIGYLSGRDLAYAHAEHIERVRNDG